MGEHKRKSKSPVLDSGIANDAGGASGPAEPARASLSVAFIVKNEESTLKRILDIANLFADELIVVDTGSTDNTVSIAEAAGAQVHHFEWIDDFAAARNFAFSKCTKDWIMWLDADDVLTREGVAAVEWVRKNLLTKDELRTVFCPYHYEYDDKGALSVNLNRERFLRNHIGHEWVGRIHETLKDPWPQSVRAEKPIIEHRPQKVQLDRKTGRNLKIFEQYIDIEKDSLRELFLYGSELQQNNKSEEAVKVFVKYLERCGDKNDGVGEKYSVLMKLADTYYTQKNLTEGLTYALQCIRLDPTRAEGYTLAGAMYFFGGFPQAAIPFLTAATVCPLPAPTTSLVVYKLYSDVPMTLYVQALQQLKTRAPIDRMKNVGAGLTKMAKELGI